MIDTIVLTLSKTDFTITDPSRFVPNAQWALEAMSFNHRLQSKQNPTKKELRQGLYKPILTLYNRNASGPFLRIELSLPKLFFGNNFSELQVKNLHHLTGN